MDFPKVIDEPSLGGVKYICTSRKKAWTGGDLLEIFKDDTMVVFLDYFIHFSTRERNRR